MNSYFIQSEEHKKQHILSSLNLNKNLCVRISQEFNIDFRKTARKKSEFSFLHQPNVN